MCFQFLWLGKGTPWPLALPKWGSASPCLGWRTVCFTNCPAPTAWHSLVRWNRYLKQKYRNHPSFVSLGLGAGDRRSSYSAILAPPSYSFFNYRPLSALNVHLHFLQKECFITAQYKLRFNSVSWMHRTVKSFTDCFCVVFIWTYSFFRYRTLSALNVHLHFLQKECFRTAQ